VDRERELAQKAMELQTKTDRVRMIEDEVRTMQTHIEQQDQSNERYQADNAKLHREVENLKAIEGQLRSCKSQLESEKEMRTTAEFDIQKLRLEISDLSSAKTYGQSQHTRAMDDLKYQNEENIKKLNIQADDINEL